MTGPEHYLEAERRAAEVQAALNVAATMDTVALQDAALHNAVALATLANAHATLALAAASVIDSEAMVREPENGRPAFAAWLAVTT